MRALASKTRPNLFRNSKSVICFPNVGHSTCFYYEDVRLSVIRFAVNVESLRMSDDSNYNSQGSNSNVLELENGHYTSDSDSDSTATFVG